MALLAQRFSFKCFYICIFLLTLTCIKDGGAHGLESIVSESVGVTSTIDFQYSDGSPASFAQVKIWSPENDSIEFQNGRTDANGRFTFVPDADGVWRITVNDGMGHAVTLEPELSRNADSTITKGSTSSSAAGSNRLFSALFGCSLILNLGFLVGRFKECISWRVHRKSRSLTADSGK